MLRVVGVAIFTVIVAFLISTKLRMGKKKTKMKLRAVAVDVGGEDGVAMRHAGYPELVEVPWEGATTIAALFEQSCLKFSQRLLLGSRKLISSEYERGSDGGQVEKQQLGEYEWRTYTEAFDCVCNFASGLVKLGHDLDSRAAIFSETRAEWFIALQGCFRQNITVVTAYASLGEDALVYSLNETGVTTLICDSKQLKMVVAISSKLESLINVVYIEDDPSQFDYSALLPSRTVLSFSEALKLGKSNPHPPRLPSKNDMALVMYTSGSTGMPKGVRITHANIVATVAGVLKVIHPKLHNNTYLAYLPLAHVLEFICEFVLIASGCAIGYGSPLTLTNTSNKIKQGTMGDAPMLKPTVMTAVPAILDRVRAGVMKKIEDKGGITMKLFSIAYSRRLAAIEGRSWFGAGIERAFWDAIIFKPIRSMLGGQIWYMLCGGAPLSADTHRFINICMGSNLAIGYGLTETCAAATFTEWDDTNVGHVGPPIPCCNLKLVSWEEGEYRSSDKPLPRGEIVIGGHSVTSGYLNNEEKTNEVYKVDERGMRWFYTGDIGQFHPDGTLEIIDRKKDIVKLQHGEYVSLGKVEAALRTSSYVDNIMVYADPFRDYCIALVVPSHPSLRKWAEGAGILYTDISNLCDQAETVKEVQQSLSEVAKDAKLGKFEIPVKIRLLPDQWTPESGLVTAALKIKREQLKARFKDELQKLYE